MKGNLSLDKAVARFSALTRIGSPVDKKRLVVRLLTVATVLLLVLAGSPLADIHIDIGTVSAESNPYVSAESNPYLPLGTTADPGVSTYNPPDSGS